MAGVSYALPPVHVAASQKLLELNRLAVEVQRGSFDSAAGHFCRQLDDLPAITLGPAATRPRHNGKQSPWPLASWRRQSRDGEPPLPHSGVARNDWPLLNSALCTDVFAQLPVDEGPGCPPRAFTGSTRLPGLGPPSPRLSPHSSQTSIHQKQSSGRTPHSSRTSLQRAMPVMYQGALSARAPAKFERKRSTAGASRKGIKSRYERTSSVAQTDSEPVDGRYVLQAAGPLLRPPSQEAVEKYINQAKNQLLKIRSGGSSSSSEQREPSSLIPSGSPMRPIRLRWQAEDCLIDHCQLMPCEFFNHIEHHGELTTAAGLARNLASCDASGTVETCRFFPRCYIITQSNERDSFEIDFKRSAAMKIALQHLRLDLQCPVDTGAGGYLCNLNILGEVKHALQQWCFALDPGNPENQSLEGRGVEESRTIDRSSWMRVLVYSTLSDDDLAGETRIGTRARPEFRGNHWGTAPPAWRAALAGMVSRLEALFPQWPLQGGHRGQNAWVVKPSRPGTDTGPQPHWFNKLPQLLQAGRAPAVCVVQKCVERPLLLFGGRKFDLRQWVLLRSVRPLRGFIFSEGYVQICEQPYDDGELDSKARHLPVARAAMAMRNSTFNMASSGPMVASQTEFEAQLKWATGSSTILRDELMPQVLHIVRSTLRAVEGKLRPRPENFELCCFNFIVDEGMHVWLTGVSSGANCEGGAPFLDRLLERMANRLVEVAVLGYEEPDAKQPDWVLACDDTMDDVAAVEAAGEGLEYGARVSPSESMGSREARAGSLEATATSTDLTPGNQELASISARSAGPRGQLWLGGSGHPSNRGSQELSTVARWEHSILSRSPRRSLSLDPLWSLEDQPRGHIRRISSDPLLNNLGSTPLARSVRGFSARRNPPSPDQTPKQAETPARRRSRERSRLLAEPMRLDDDDDPKAPTAREMAEMIYLSKLHQIPLAEVRRCRQEYIRLDTDDDGMLSHEEFATALHDLCDLREDEDLPDHLVKEMKMADKDGSGNYSFEEFVLWYVKTAWYEERVVANDDERQLRKLAKAHNMHMLEFEKAKAFFDGADLQRTGRLDLEAFKSVLLKLMRVKKPSDFPEQKMNRHWREADTSNNGSITIEEFVAWYASSVDGQDLLMQRRPTKDLRTPSKASPSQPATPNKADAPPKPAQQPEVIKEPDKAPSSNDGMATLASRLEVADALLIEADAIFSDAQVAELRSVFLRWRLPFGEDIHRESLPDMVEFLGYDVPSFDELHELVDQITVFSELGFLDFQSFIENFVKQEHRRLRSVFDQLAASEALQPGHLRSLLSGIGLTMRRGKVREALEHAGLAEAAGLTFERCVRFVAAYRHMEGFTSDEVGKLRRIFERSSQGENDHIPIPAMATALVQMFGAQAQKHVDRISKRFSSSHRQYSAPGHVATTAGGSSGNAPVPRIRLHDFLVSARWLRDAVQRQYRTEFGLRDREGTGTISTGELQSALRRLGYEPLSGAINEVLQELDKERTGELDMDEFFHFMTLYNARDGFSAKDLEEIVSVFTRYDVDRSNTISVTELQEIFQHLGYTVLLEDVRVLLKEVDLDGNLTLDLLEFQRLMRRHRDGTVRKLRHSFTVYQQGGLEGPNARMPASRVSAALIEALDCEAEEISSLVPSEAVDFETFFSLAEHGRALCVSRKQRKAGFCEEEIEQIREIFEERAHKTCETKIEVLPLLTELGMQFRTEKDRQELVKHLHEARKMALQVTVEDVSPAGSTKLGFWEFLQLMRVLRSEQLRAEESRVARVIQDLGFTLQEAEQFRETFLSWTRRSQHPQESGRSGEGLANLFRPAATQSGLSTPDFYKLLRTLGLSMSQRQREMLERQVVSTEPETPGVVSFGGFLRLMRWLLDTDFAGINKMIIPRAA